MVLKHKTYLLPGRNEGRSKSTFRQLRISTPWTSKGYKTKRRKIRRGSSVGSVSASFASGTFFHVDCLTFSADSRRASCELLAGNEH